MVEVPVDTTAKAGRWGCEVHRDLGGGKTRPLYQGSFMVRESFGSDCDACDRLVTKDTTWQRADNVAGSSTGGLVLWYGGPFLAGAKQRYVHLRVWPGCCGPDGGGWREFILWGVLQNNSSMSGTATGGALALDVSELLEGDVFTCRWEGPP